MSVAVFDFDGTLAYSSTLTWLRPVPLPLRLFLLLTYPITRIVAPGFFQRRAFEYLTGRRLNLAEIRRRPPVEAGLNYLRELESKGYRIIVMSFSPGIVVREWLQAHGVEAEVICPELVVKRGRVVGVADDEFTQIFLSEPVEAKRLILEKLNLKPDISVGDTHKDIVGEKHFHVSELGRVPSRIRQLLT